MASGTAMVEALAESAREVFETMVFRPLTDGPALDVSDLHGDYTLGVVGFTGSKSGSITVILPGESSLAVAASMLGLEPSEMDSGSGDVADAVGELANLIGGTFRNRMAEGQDVWRISTPTIVTGNNLRTRYPADATRSVLSFRVDQHLVVVELALHTGDTVQDHGGQRAGVGAHPAGQPA
ncbi:MAG: chemotaxis protein CheX [Vicinamibacterales bacterium]